MGKINYYSSEKISDCVTRITSLTGEFMYLVEGMDKAVLIDTCLGVGHLRDFVEKLTNKPITVILTHGHVDHAMGAPEFDTVYMNMADKPVFQEHMALEVRKGYIMMGLGDRMKDFEDSDFVPPSDPDFNELTDGMIFHLGGIDLEIFETPGHTPGSITILMKEERALLLGDACNSSTFLFDDRALSVEEYKNSLQRLDGLTRGKFDKVYLSHGVGTVPKEMLTSVIQVCDDIMTGNTDEVPFDFMGHKAFLAKAMRDDRKRIDGGLGNIIYNKDKVYAKK